MSPRARLTYSHYDQLIHAAVAGQGVAIGRAELVNRLVRSGQLVPLGNSRRDVAGRGFWLINASTEPAPVCVASATGCVPKEPSRWPNRCAAETGARTVTTAAVTWLTFSA